MTPLPVMAVPPEPLPAAMLATLELVRLRAAVLVRDGAPKTKPLPFSPPAWSRRTESARFKDSWTTGVFLVHRDCGTRRADPGCPCPMTTTSHCVRWAVRSSSNR